MINFSKSNILSQERKNQNQIQKLQNFKFLLKMKIKLLENIMKMGNCMVMSLNIKILVKYSKDIMKMVLEKVGSKKKYSINNLNFVKSNV